MHLRLKCLLLLGIVATAGCNSVSTGQKKHGPNGTIEYSIQIESSEPGGRVEINDDYVGKTPLEVKVWGDRDGTFHNFGAADYVIKVFPVKEGQTGQMKVFRTGGWFGQEDQIPRRLFFDLDQKGAGGFTAEPGKPRF